MTDTVVYEALCCLVAGIDLENIVYYRDNTHYFVMTAKKQSLLDKGVIIHVSFVLLLCAQYATPPQSRYLQLCRCAPSPRGCQIAAVALNWE